ncbi:DNA-binding transcriptional LysR family regulator [Roseiarcus fermentans]|uniref:DNA-binding transcriptional LysR family regulator n=1 Tax=Roseiarcus fermentans TaxID=1473586 RepID=A0A366EHX6_9HYPH|nr:LysR family transcriptional regulator [Roseiarcus fermentans]RBP02017.1 DNA-binding transcriptional LysR family regulator [Roseiarcus fermentans]
MDRLASMAAFVKAADLGSFAAAAHALRISPQMVAKHVVFLEDRLGAPLLNRTTRRQSLTDVGRAYCDRCRSILAEAEAADALAQEIRARPRGVLKVNAPVTFGSFSLTPFVTRYLARQPEMQIELTLCDRYVDPLEEDFDVIVRIGESGDAGLFAHPLQPYRLIACASPAYLAARGAPRTPADLAGHDCLAYGHWSPGAPCRWRFERRGRIEEARIASRLRSNNWSALLEAAIDGFGVTLGPESVLAREIEAGRLHRVLPDYEGPARPMRALRRAGPRPTVKTHSFVAALVAAFGAPAAADPAGAESRPSAA